MNEHDIEKPEGGSWPELEYRPRTVEAMAKQMPWYGRIVWLFLPSKFKRSLSERIETAIQCQRDDLTARRRIEGWIPPQTDDPDPLMSVYQMAAARQVSMMAVDGDGRVVATDPAKRLGHACISLALSASTQADSDEVEFDVLSTTDSKSATSALAMMKERGRDVGALMFAFDAITAMPNGANRLRTALREACAWRGMTAYFGRAATIMERNHPEESEDG